MESIWLYKYVFKWWNMMIFEKFVAFLFIACLYRLSVLIVRHGKFLQSDARNLFLDSKRYPSTPELRKSKVFHSIGLLFSLWNITKPIVFIKLYNNNTKCAYCEDLHIRILGDHCLSSLKLMRVYFYYKILLI